MRGPREFIHTISAVTLFVVLETASVLLIFNHSIIQRTAIMGSLREVRAFFWDKSSAISSYFGLKDENASLLEENISLRNALERYRKDTSPADSIPDGGLYIYRGATVIHNSISSQHNFLVLSKGEEDGVREGMGVITADGVVGVVDAVSPHCCRVLSLLNTSMIVSVRFASSGAFGPMSWTGGSITKASVTEIPMHIEIDPGEQVLTSGYSSIFPPDIPVGVVNHVLSPDGLSQNVEVELSENFSSLKSVFIVESILRDEINLLTGNGK